MRENAFHCNKKEMLIKKYKRRSKKRPIMSERFLLFYSENCPFCSEILEELKNAKLLKFIRLFSVDENRARVPRCITNVPTLYISKDKKYVGGDIYQWMHDINNVYAPNENHASKMIHSQSNVNIPKEISSLDDTSAFSSGYTFLTEEKEAGEFLEHKFTFIHNKHEPIQTLEEDSSSSKCTSQDYDAYLKKRSLDMKRIQP